MPGDRSGLAKYVIVLVPVTSHLVAFGLGVYAHRSLVSGDLQLLSILQSAENERTWRKRLLVFGLGGAVLFGFGAAVMKKVR